MLIIQQFQQFMSVYLILFASLLHLLQYTYNCATGFLDIPLVYHTMWIYHCQGYHRLISAHCEQLIPPFARISDFTLKFFRFFHSKNYLIEGGRRNIPLIQRRYQYFLEINPNQILIFSGFLISINIYQYRFNFVVIRLSSQRISLHLSFLQKMMHFLRKTKSIFSL